MVNIIEQKSLELMSNGGDAGAWQNGQDSLLRESEFVYSFSGQSAEQSAEESQAVTYTQEYDMGDMEGYSIGTLGTLALYGLCAGFGLALGSALLAYAISCVISAFRGMTTE